MTAFYNLSYKTFTGNVAVIFENIATTAITADTLITRRTHIFRTQDSD
ncbi:MAG: hypothetical protein LKM34_05000 [Prevotella sp.]|nr:hypothetical protein [Prevotella sp.]